MAIDRRAKEAMEAVFRDADTNHDGVLSIDEFVVAAQQVTPAFLFFRSRWEVFFLLVTQGMAVADTDASEVLFGSGCAVP